MGREFEIVMTSKTFRTQLVFALLAAIALGWGSHAAAWLKGPAQLSAVPHLDRQGHSGAHAHAHEQPALNCRACEAAHGHSHWLGEHIHETPHPSTLLRLQAQAERLDLPPWPCKTLPAEPVFRIERPPRQILLT